jgi:GrpB-like predicted nucleotidyltransferase (UPF0157 family)
MKKELSEMTLEELWELFPIFLVEHDDKWEDSYNEIENSIKEILSGFPVDRISHIGSTAINGIWAKNIVDVMIEIPENSDMEEIARILEQNGDELYFRDYLNEHPEIAKEYEALKLGLWKKYEHNRDAYTEAKTDFIRKWTIEARRVYGDRYSKE